MLTPRLTVSRLRPLQLESLRYGLWDAVDTKHDGTPTLEVASQEVSGQT